MKNLILVLLMAMGWSLNSFAQQDIQPTAKHFAQCMLSIEDETEFRALETDLRNNPNVAVVRLDWVSKRAFLLTKEMGTFSESDFIAWLGEYSDEATCIQVGVHGVDQINPYPFTNCANN